MGLLLWARRAGDIDRLLPGAQQQPHRTAWHPAAKAGSDTFSADVGS